MRVSTAHERVSRQEFIYDERDIYRLTESDAKASQLWVKKPIEALEKVVVEWHDDMTVRVTRTFTYPDAAPKEQ